MCPDGRVPRGMWLVPRRPAKGHNDGQLLVGAERPEVLAVLGQRAEDHVADRRRLAARGGWAIGPFPPEFLAGLLPVIARRSRGWFRRVRPRVAVRRQADRED